MVGVDSCWGKVLQVQAGQLVRVGKSKAGTWYYVFVGDKAFWENLPQVLHRDRVTGARHAAEMRSRICVRLDTSQGELLLCMHAYV